MERLRIVLAKLCLAAAIRLDGELVDLYTEQSGCGCSR